MKKITHEEYLKAYEIMQRFENQNKTTHQASVTYNAEVHVTLQVPKNMTVEELKEALEYGYYDFDQEEKEYIKILNMTELFVNGDEIKI